MLRFVCKIRKPTQAELLAIDIKKQAAKASKRRSRSRSPSNSREKAFGAKSSLLQNYKFCIFSPLESKSKVVAIEEPLLGKEILNKYTSCEELEKSHENAFAAEPHSFDFDSVVDENFRKEKLYVLHVKNLIKRSMKGENTCVVLFGPSEDNSSGILKYTNGKEKGILGRAIEDILEFRDLYGYNKLSIVINAYQIYLERIEDLLGDSKSGKKQNQKTPQVVKVADPDNHLLVDQVMNLGERLVTKGKDIISVVQEISKNRSKFATKNYGISVEEIKKKSHLVLMLNLYSDYGKPTENKISEIMLIELCGSEQAAIGSSSSMKSSMSDKEFASKSFNSLSQVIINNTVNKGKINKGKDEVCRTILSMIFGGCVKNPSTNCVFVCKVSPHSSVFKHSLTAIKFSNKLYSTLRKRIKLVIPDEIKEKHYETVTSNVLTEDDECAKLAENERNLHFQSSQNPYEEHDSNMKHSELLSGYITETEQSQFKSLELLGYLISDLKEFLDRPEQDRISQEEKEEWFEECQEKIAHIEDIIKRLPEESRIEFIETGKSLELKSLVEQVRIRRKEYMVELNCHDPGIFDQSKRYSDGFSTNRSGARNESSNNRFDNSKIKENTSIEANSTLCPGSKRDTSVKQRNHSLSYENASKSEFDSFNKTKDNNEINIQNSSMRNSQIKQGDYNKISDNLSENKYPFNNSLPPPHPSKFSQRKYDDRSLASSRKNDDLKMENDRKNDFLTVGKNSSIQPNVCYTDRSEFQQQPQSSFYQVMSKQSERIIEYYKNQNDQSSKKCLNESYDSLKSCSEHDSNHNEDSLDNEPNFASENYKDYNTIRSAEGGRIKHERHEAMLSPDQYSTGNILEQIDNDSHNMSISNTRIVEPSANPHVQISVIEEKSSNFKEVLRQYIEKCRLLELELLKREDTLNRFKDESRRMQGNMELLKDELIKSEKENQNIRDNQVEFDRRIYELTSENTKLKEKSMINEELVTELKSQLHSEKGFNIKVAENLAKQTQETNKAKNSENSRCLEISELNSKILKLEEFINSKNDKLAEMQNEKLEDMKKFKDLKEKYEAQLRRNDELCDKLHDAERKNEEFSKKIIEKTKDLSNVDEELQGKDDFIKKIKDDNLKLKDKSDVLDIKNRELLKTNLELNNTIEELEKRLKETEDEREQILDDMEIREQNNTKYALETTEKLADYDRIKHEFEDLEKTLEEKDQELIIIKAREYTAFCDGQVDDIKIKYRRLEDERAKLEIKADRLEKENRVLKKEKDEISQELQFLQASQSERIDELDMKFQLLHQEHKTCKDLFIITLKMIEKEDEGSPRKLQSKFVTTMSRRHSNEDYKHIDSDQEKGEEPVSALYATLPKGVMKTLTNKNIKLTDVTSENFEYTPESPEFDFISVKLSPNFKIKPLPGAIYFGEIIEGKRHGKGVMKYDSNRVYEGDWEEDVRSGKGFEHFANGNTYVGEYKKSRPCGKGVYKWINGEVYDGEWLNGLKHGYGIWKGIYNDSYIGEWKNSRADGYGVHTWSNGDRYEGEWKACLKNGNGTDIFANGDVYIGQYKEGKPNGYGQFIYSNGGSYVGNFKDGMKHGFGKWKMKNEKGAITNSYEGEYFNDVKQGDGVFRWASGNVYVGKYKNDERDGQGEMIWTDGSKYIDNFIERSYKN